MKKFVCSLLLLISLCEASAAAPAGAGGVCEREMSGAAAEAGVPLGVLYAVAMTETGRKGSLHPYALNIEGLTVITTTKQDALAEYDRARRSGKKLIDLGCMQVNHHYHGRAFASVSAMLDPALNVRYAARFLKDLRQKEGSWAMAVARYHAGPHNDPAQKRYICAVIRNLVATGFGAWTPASRQFCR
ncbi:transglycosylase SLT domain-containing protein [Aestuariivirga sp.]|uniref:transglycosylase SLT domain-containing protein n=1 Tax=Aestuariivirga sp. TaxID=2650926 RepID=UPI0025C72140|nr:transglycosylase SLT domain-containing protein [Aestuariivirga sp.]MCA3554251.1 transglycosylase SLT domain-containing protein [Aestuariivirga sp.]